MIRDGDDLQPLFDGRFDDLLSCGARLFVTLRRRRVNLKVDLPVLGVGELRKSIDNIAAKKTAIDDAAPGTQSKDYDVARSYAEKVDKRRLDAAKGKQFQEFMASPGRPSPLPITMDGFELRSSLDACSGVSEMRAASQVMLMCGT